LPISQKALAPLMTNSSLTFGSIDHFTIVKHHSVGQKPLAQSPPAHFHISISSHFVLQRAVDQSQPQFNSSFLSKIYTDLPGFYLDI
jgi:hypothetical protein